MHLKSKFYIQLILFYEIFTTTQYYIKFKTVLQVNLQNKSASVRTKTYFVQYIVSYYFRIPMNMNEISRINLKKYFVTKPRRLS